jgi:hypothetical protein
VVVHVGVNDVPARFTSSYRSDYAHFRGQWRPPRYGALFRALVRASDLFAFAAMTRSQEMDVRSFVDHPRAPGSDRAPMPPESTDAFRRNVRTIGEHVRLRGGSPVLATLPYKLDEPHFENHKRGIDEHNEILRRLASEHGWLLVDVAAEFRSRHETVGREFVDLVHLAAEGNRVKAALIARALEEAKLLEARKGR